MAATPEKIWLCMPLIKTQKEDYPGGAMAKNPPADAGDTGLTPGPGRSHMPRSN